MLLTQQQINDKHDVLPNQSLAKCVFSIMWRNYVICLRFLLTKHGKSNYQNGKYGDSMETVLRVILFMVKLVWRLCGVFMKKTWQIKLPDNLHINYHKFSMKSSTLNTVSLLSA